MLFYKFSEIAHVGMSCYYFLKIARVIPLSMLPRLLVPVFFFFFFLIGKKNYIKKTARSKIATAKQKNIKKESKNKIKQKLQRKRAKEKSKRVTRCESPSPSPIK